MVVEVGVYVSVGWGVGVGDGVMVEVGGGVAEERGEIEKACDGVIDGIEACSKPGRVQAERSRLKRKTRKRSLNEIMVLLPVFLNT